MQRFDPAEDIKYRTIFGALAVPGEGKGFIVVVGKEKDGAERLIQLDEVETNDIRELVRQAAAMDLFYHPNAWIGDYDNPVMKDFIREANADNEIPGDRKFVLRRTRLLDKKDNLYSYILPIIKNMVCRGNLILKGMVKAYINLPQENDIPDMKLGDYPSIEALAFACIEIDQQRNRRGQRQKRANNDYIRA